MTADRTEFLKLPTTTDLDRIAALKALDPDLVAKDDAGKDKLGHVYTHDIAAHYFPDVVLVPAVVDTTDPQNPIVITPAVMGGPHMMIRYVSGQREIDQDTRLETRRKAREESKPIPKRGDLPPELEDVELDLYSWSGDDKPLVRKVVRRIG